MDTSETYIKMCDHPLIQQKIQECGDDYNRFRHIEITKEHIKAVWLPRQDQTQKILGIEDVDDFYEAVFDIFFKSDATGHYNALPKWRVMYYDSTERFSTPDQLLLGYYMHEKHSLIWENDKWVKE